jgi:hypothetical protein
MNTPHDYGSLDWETAKIVERAAERIDEKEPDYGGERWEGDDPRFHVYHAMRNLGDVATATDETPEYDEMLTQAADVLNHLCMALANVEQERSEELQQ